MASVSTELLIGGDAFSSGVCWYPRLGEHYHIKEREHAGKGLNVPDVSVSGSLTIACGSVLGPKVWESSS